MEIQGYPNYLIYEDGRVWSKNRGGKFLKPGKNNDGYLQLVLWKDQKGKTMRIHRLVALSIESEMIIVWRIYDGPHILRTVRIQELIPGINRDINMFHMID